MRLLLRWDVQQQLKQLVSVSTDHVRGQVTGPCQGCCIRADISTMLRTSQAAACSPCSIKPEPAAPRTLCLCTPPNQSQWQLAQSEQLGSM